jgi:hypothetical protein
MEAVLERSKFMNWLNKLEKKFGKFAINKLMLDIVSINAGVYMMLLIKPALYDKLILDPSMVMRGEVWRLITFVFLPPQASILWIFLILYMSFLIGSSLEREWGSFKFNVYYFMGIIGTIIAAFIGGNAVTAVYLNLSLFLAFARIYPDYEILLFFVLSVKVKYLAWLELAFIGFTIITAPVSLKLAAIASLINYLIFFGKDIYIQIKTRKQVSHNKELYNSKVYTKDYFHKCTVCGITEKENPKMDFRYCSTCEGNFEYCMDHLKNHEHIKKNT